MQICIMFDDILNYLKVHTIGVLKADTSHIVYIAAMIVCSFRNSSKKKNHHNYYIVILDFFDLIVN